MHYTIKVYLNFIIKFLLLDFFKLSLHLSVLSMQEKCWRCLWSACYRKGNVWLHRHMTGKQWHARRADRCSSHFLYDIFGKLCALTVIRALSLLIVWDRRWEEQLAGQWAGLAEHLLHVAQLLEPPLHANCQQLPRQAKSMWMSCQYTHKHQTAWELVCGIPVLDAGWTVLQKIFTYGAWHFLLGVVVRIIMRSKFML